VPLSRRSLPAALWLALLGAAAPAAAATLPPGFQETAVIQGRSNPTAIRFGPAGQIFVAEKSGLVFFYDSFDDASPTQVVDLRASVHNFWDRGLLGLAVHPDFPATPYLYVLYAHDTWPPDDPRFGDPTQPRWGTGLPTPGSNDPCPTPPGPTGEGCVVFGRLSRIAVNPVSMVGSEQVMLQGNWCQQYPSHSTGDLVFGEDGYLYVSAGDGASFNFADWGQDGDPVNPCDDPPDGIGGPNNTIAAEGGALRSQDILTPASVDDPTSLDGALLRLDVSTQPPTAPATNPLVGNGVADDDFIVAIGLRNPFRINKRPGTDEIWITDVGWGTWEEVNRVQDVTGSVEDFGWPCYEGNNSGSAKQSGYQNQTLCRRLYGEVGPAIPSGIGVVAPYYAYNHSAQVVPGEICGTGSSSATGIVFNSGGNFPAEYDDALFFADSSRQCVWTIFAGAGGLPDKTDIAPLVSQASGRVVDIQMDADGRLYYVDFDNGRIYRVEHFVANQPPTAAIAAAPTSGMAPLLVQFDASGSSDPEDGTSLLYAWDLDGDGAFDDSTAVFPSWSYTQAGGQLVRLRVEDSDGGSDVESVLISVDNTPPVAAITAPAPGFQWSVGESIDYALSGTDLQNGVLPGSQLELEIIMHHCDSPEHCHTHPLTTVSGAVGGSFPAPDHEYPSHLELRLTAEDLPPANWLDPSWGARRKLRFDNSAQAETLTDFPVLVTLDASRIDYGKTRPGGADLRFASAAGDALAYEIEVWNPAGVSRVWVRVPQITAGSTQDHVYMYYDNPLAADAQDPAGVWSNGYAGVWHLHGDLLDSTAHANHGSNNGSSNAAGRIGDGQSFDGGDWIEVASSASLSITGQLSLEAWTALANPAQAGAPRVLSKKNVWNDANGYNLEQKPAEANVTTVGSGGDYIRAQGLSFDSGWHYLATTASGSSGRVYYDGVDRTTDSTLSALVAGTQPLSIGRASATGDYFTGSIDEVRISSVQRSAAWIAAQHRSMTDSFISYEGESGPGTLTHTVSLLLYPDTMQLTLDSVPQGLALALGGDTLTTPAAQTLIVGSSNSVAALSPQPLGGASYSFAAWSDGGAQSHQLTAPAGPLALTATFLGDVACGDGADNDADAFVDLADPGCAGPGDASEQNAEVACDDGADNDADGLVDLADPGCAGLADASEQNALAACDDGVDNDGDGSADAADPGCDGPGDASEQNAAVACDDGADNDHDGASDWPADPECASATDPDEAGVPQVPALPVPAALLLSAGLLAAARRRALSRCPEAPAQIS
jgi:glucose/arabinose dehydrogenase